MLTFLILYAKIYYTLYDFDLENIMKRVFILVLSLIALMLSLTSCFEKTEEGDRLIADFNYNIFTTSLTEEDLEENCTIFLYKKEGGIEPLTDGYEISCDIKEGYCNITVTYEEISATVTKFFVEREKLVTEGNFLFYTYRDKPFLFRYKGSNKELVLPEKEVPYGIFDDAFSGISSLKSIDLGDSVVSIGKNAFKENNELERVDFGKNVKTVSCGAFTGCESLKYVGVDSLEQWCAITFDASGAATSLSNATGVEIFNGVINPGSGFSATDNGATQYVPSGTTSGAVTISPSYTIQGFLFSHENCVESFGDTNTFFVTDVQNSDSLDGKKNEYEYEDGKIYIIGEDGERLFWDYMGVSNPLFYAHSLYVNGQKLESLVVPSEVTKINAHAFAYSDIKSVELHEKVLSVGKRAFYLCEQLERVLISGKEISLGSKAFDGTKSAYTEYENGLYLGNSETPYYLLVTLKNKDVKDNELIIHADTKAIAANALNDLNGVTKIVLPDGLCYVGANAFKNAFTVTVSFTDVSRWYTIGDKKEEIPLTEAENVTPVPGTNNTVTLTGNTNHQTWYLK